LSEFSLILGGGGGDGWSFPGPRGVGSEADGGCRSGPARQGSHGDLGGGGTGRRSSPGGTEGGGGKVVVTSERWLGRNGRCDGWWGWVGRGDRGRTMG